MTKVWEQLGLEITSKQDKRQVNEKIDSLNNKQRYNKKNGASDKNKYHKTNKQKKTSKRLSKTDIIPTKIFVNLEIIFKGGDQEK